MSIEQFERELRSKKRSQPFRPFSMLLKHGRTIVVEEPAIAFDGGRAVLLRERDVEIVDCEDVKEFRLAQEEPAA